MLAYILLRSFFCRNVHKKYVIVLKFEPSLETNFFLYMCMSVCSWICHRFPILLITILFHRKIHCAIFLPPPLFVCQVFVRPKKSNKKWNSHATQMNPKKFSRPLQKEKPNDKGFVFLYLWPLHFLTIHQSKGDCLKLVQLNSVQSNTNLYGLVMCDISLCEQSNFNPFLWVHTYVYVGDVYKDIDISTYIHMYIWHITLVLFHILMLWPNEYPKFRSRL